MSKLNSLHGFLAGILLSLKTWRKTKTTIEDLKRIEFKTAAQGLGLRFTKRIRNVFRFKWIKKL